MGEVVRFDTRYCDPRAGMDAGFRADGKAEWKTGGFVVGGWGGCSFYHGGRDGKTRFFRLGFDSEKED